MKTTPSPTRPEAGGFVRSGALANLWRRLIEPRGVMPEPERRRARMLSGVLLSLLLLIAFPVILLSLLDPAYPRQNPTFLVTVGVAVMLAAAYSLNRAGRVRAAMFLTVVVVALAIWAIVIVNHDDAGIILAILPYMVASVLLSSLLLSVQATILLALAHLAVSLSLFVLDPHLVSPELVNTLLFIGIVIFLIVAATVLRQQDLKQIERQTRELAESEERLRLLFAASPDSILLIDPADPHVSWPIVDCNEVACRMNGYTREELIGQSIDLLNEHPGDPVERAAYLERIRREEGVLHFETVHRHKDGHLFTVEVLTSIITFGDRELALGIDRDITERKRAEAALRESQARYRALFEDSPISLWEEDYSAVKQRIEALRRQGVTDFRAFFEAHPEVVVEGMAAVKIVDVNNATLRLFGAGSKAELLADLSRIIPPEARSLFQDELVQIAEGRKEFEWESVNRTLAGKMMDVNLRWVAAPGYEDTLAKVFVSILDISERRRTEEALQTANEKLILGMAELEQRTREIGMLNRTGDVLQNCLNAEEAYAVIGQSAQQLFPDEAGALYMISASRDVVEAVAAWGQSPFGNAQGKPAEVLECVFAPQDCWALRRSRPHLVEDTSAGPLCRHLTSPPPATYVCIPMMVHSEATGVLYLQNRGGSLPPAKLQLAQTVADSTALAIANLKLRETLRHQSIRDLLTGLFNRRYMEETLEREMRRVARAQRPLGIIMLDADNFKLFNDTFGHDAGDALLREFGNFLRAHVRGEDVACRYGGEEFTLILPEASLEVTRQRAEHLRGDIQHLHVQYHDQPLGAVTLSLGVAVFPDHGSTGEAVLKAADAALYRAKREGRDRVVVAE